MRSALDYRPVSLETRRIPLLRTVSLVYEGEEKPIEEMGINLSMTGMFVRTGAPRPAGSTATFSLTLAEGEVPIVGLAEVMWVRDEEEGHYQPPGMGMRFLKVSGEGRRRIRETVERLVEETSAPAEMRDLRLVVEETLEDVLAQRSGGSDPGPRAPSPASPRVVEAGFGVARSALDAEKRRRVRLLLIPLSILAATAGIVLFLRTAGPPEKPTPAAVENPAGQAPDSEAKAPEDRVDKADKAEEAEEAEVEGEEAASRAGVSEVRSAVAAWAAAWSQQRAVDYLNHYAAQYQPPSGLGREEWEAQRRNRLAAPKFIQVSIVDLDVRLLGADRAEARFLQSYRSDRYRDSVKKVLLLVHRDGRWQILEERDL